MANDTILISTAYLPPVSYMKACLGAGEIILESREHFIKQSYRNRCKIYSANGPLSLVIPVQHKNLYSDPISNVSMSDDVAWKNIHWRSITSAYRKSPFFEFYEEDIKSLYETDEINLFNFNLNCLNLLFKLLKLQASIKHTEIYEVEANAKDLRTSIHPKCPPNESAVRYHQVFEDRNGFIPDLSVLDLLCNLGPESKRYLLSY